LVSSAVPISWQTLFTYLRSSEPFALLGVPTQTSDISDWLTASAGLLVARNCFSLTIVLISSVIPSSIIGLSPRLIISTLTGFGSTPMTSCPSLAKHAADTQPTYPSPNTLTFNLLLP